jgi:hypothetical protein
MKQRGFPAAFQRTPPNSQKERSRPHEHATIHWRDSTSMLRAHLAGKMRTRNLCTIFIGVLAEILFDGPQRALGCA